MTPDFFTPSTSVYQPFSPMDGLGVGGSGIGGLMTQVALQSLMGAGGGMGYAPMGVNDRNLLDRMNHLDMTMQHRQAVQNAAANDRPMFDQIGRGMANIAGYKYNPAMQQMAGLFHKGYQSMAPMLMEMPGAVDLFDSFSPTGNQAAMTHGVFKAGRKMMDPFSGRFGMSGAGSAAMTDSLFQQLYANGNYASMPLKAGAFGSMLDELQTRGMGPTLMSGGGTPSARLQSIFQAAGVKTNDVGSLTVQDRDKLQQLFKSDPASASAAYGEMSKLDSKKSASKLKDMAGAVEAIREIFGDAGNPNAPMSQLIDGLNQLTAGGLSQLNPGKLNGMVRTTYNLAKSTGMGMEATTMMTQLGAAYANQLGLSPVFGALATQDSLAFTQAMQANGVNQNPMWGRSDIAQLGLANQRLTLGAFNSHTANRMGLAMRLGDTVKFGKGSDAANYIEAVKNGQDTFMMGGKMRSTVMEENEFRDMMAAGSGGNLTAGMVGTLLTQTHANQEYLANNPEAAMIARRAQGQELFRQYGQAATGVIADALKEKGIKNDKLAEKLGGMFAGAIASGKITTADVADPAKRAAFFSKQFAGEMKKHGLSEEFGGMLGTAAFGEIDQALIDNGKGTLADAMVQFNPHLLQEAARAKAVAESKAKIGAALSPLGKGGLISRFMKGIITAKDKDGLDNVALATVGGVRGEEIMNALGGDAALDPLRQQYQDMKAAADAVAAETDPAKRKALEGHSEKLNQAFALEMAKLNKTLANSGLAVEDATEDEVNAALSEVDDEKLGLEDGKRYRSMVRGLKARNGAQHEDSWKKLKAAHGVMVEKLRTEDPELLKELKLEGLLDGPDGPGGDKASSAAENNIQSVRITINGQDLGDGTLEFGSDPAGV